MVEPVICLWLWCGVDVLCLRHWFGLCAVDAFMAMVVRAWGVRILVYSVDGGGMTENESMAYVGILSCGCCVAVSVDVPYRKKDIAEFVADCIRDGMTVERQSLTWVSENLRRCTHK